jgi:hypothetical protein
MNFTVLQDRRKRFDLNMFRSQKQIQKIKELYEMCKLVVLVGETRRGEDSDITHQGSIVGLRYQQINIPFMGKGPCQMLSHSDVKSLISNFVLAIKEYTIQDSYKGQGYASQSNASIRC